LECINNRLIYGLFKKHRNKTMNLYDYHNNIKDLHGYNLPFAIEQDNNIKWYINDKVHKEDGPAVIWENGKKEWYQNGKRHRIDGPAIIYDSGRTEWYQNDKLHRDDGPAYIHVKGKEKWYLNGIEYSEEEWKNKI